MSRSCRAADLSELLGATVCYSTSPVFDSPRAVMRDVCVYSPLAQKCLIFKNRVIPLGRKIRVTIGSDPAVCDLVLVGKSIDPLHAEILYYNGSYFIQDLDSRQGTYVNGRRISGIAELKPGDEILLKPYQIRFSVTPADPSCAPTADYPAIP
jgi:hypothetical protein